MTKSRDIADSINRIDSSAADATAMTIDASENVLVGKTSSSFSTAGVQLQSNGELYVTRNGGNPVSFNRLTNDGVITSFAKDGTSVGSIGSRGSGTSFITLKTTSGAGAGLTGSDNRILPMDESALADNNTDLGMSSYRFKDLYLGGGVYVGGTGSVNYLDDYEEGTWTPVVAQGWTSVSYTNSYQNGRYTKVGNMVTAWFWMQFSGTSASNQIRVSGLPFTVPNVTAGAYRGGAVTYFSVPTDAAGAISAYVVQNQDQIFFYAMDDGGASALSNANASSDFLIGSVTYWV